MRFPGGRRVGGIILICTLLTAFFLWRALRLYGERTLENLAPTLLAQAEEILGREVKVDRLVIDRPGMVLIEGLRIARGQKLEEGELLTARRLEITYDPALFDWRVLVWGVGGRATRARLRAYDLLLWSPAPHPVEKIASTGSLSTEFDLRPILQGTGFPALRRVDLGGSHVRLVRNRKGRWNAESLRDIRFRREFPPFHGEVHATGATLDLTDYLPGHLPAPARNRATGAVIVRFAGLPAISYSTSARVAGPHGGTLETQGYSDPKTKRWSLSLQAETRDMPYWNRYFGRPDPDMEFLAAAGTCSAAFWGDGTEAGNPKPTGYRLTLGIREGAARLRDLREPIRRFRGRMIVGADLLTVDGSALVGELPVQVSGSIVPGKDPRMALRLASTQATLAAVQQLAPGFKLPEGLSVHGRGAFSCSVSSKRGAWDVEGQLSLPPLRYQDASAGGAQVAFRGRVDPDGGAAFSGTVDARAARYGDTEARKIHAGFRTAGSTIEIEGALEALGGHVKGRGWADLSGETPQFYLAGRAEGVKAEAIPLERKDLKLVGPLSAEFVASGTAKSPRVSAYIQSGPLVVNGESVQEVSGRVRYSGDRLDIAYARVTDPRLQASISGTVSSEGEMDLRLIANGVRLEKALAGRTKEPIRGAAYIRASLSGTVEQPHVEARVQVYQPSFREYDADYAAARFVAEDLNNVQVLDLNLIRAPERVTAEQLLLSRAQGEKQEWQVSGGLTLQGFSVVRALRLAGIPLERLENAPLAGDLEPIQLQVQGPVSRPALRFEGSSPRLAFQGFDLGRVTAAGSVDLTDNRIELASVTSRSSLLEMDGAGTFRFEPKALDPKTPPEELARYLSLDLTFQATNGKLLPVLRRYAPDLLKQVEFKGLLREARGRITGPVSALQVTADLKLADVLINGRAVAIEPFLVRWMPGVALVRHLEARLGSGRVVAPYLAVSLEEEKNEGQKEGHKPGPLLERVASAVEIREVPVAVVRQLLEDSPVYQTEAFRSLREALDPWRMPVSGQITGLVSVPAGAGQPLPEELIEIAALLRGRRGQARLEGKLEIPEFGIFLDDGRLDGRLSTAFTYGKGRFELARFDLEQEKGPTVSASGSYQEGQQEGQKKAPGRLALQARVDGLRLSSLAQWPIRDLRKQLEPLQPLDGTLKLRAEVDGTVKQPQARFAVEVDRPMAWGIPFDRVSLEGGEYRADQGILKIGAARLVKARSPDDPHPLLAISGVLPLKWPDLVIPLDAARNLTIDLPQQELSILNTLANDTDRLARERGGEAAQKVRWITGLFRQIAATGGRMQGKVTLGGTALAPQNDGEVRFASSVLRLEGLETEIRDFNARAQLTANVLKVVDFSGKSSQGGSFQGEGEVLLGKGLNDGSPARLNLALNVNQFKFVEKKVGRLVGESFRGTQLMGTLQTVVPDSPTRQEPLRLVGDWPSPMLKGGLLVDNASLVVALEPFTPGAIPPLPGDVRLDVRLLTGKNVWMRNPQVRLKLDGSLSATNTAEAPVVMGDVRLSRGTLTLPTLRLRNAEGLLRVAYDGRAQELGVIAPSPIYIDLTASTSMYLQRSAAVEAEDYEVFVQIRGAPGTAENAREPGTRSVGISGGLEVGTPGGFTVTVRTDPPLRSGEIEALIRQQLGVEGFPGAGANVVEALGGQIEQALAVNVGGALTGRIENAVQSALGLDIFSIDVGITQPLRLRIGKRLFGRFYGTLTQQFSPEGSDQRRSELYYRLNSRFRIGYREEEPVGRRVFFFSGSASF
jgi:translocation-and-assembly-module (TAM) inner membrane subunit TamB-like protein